MPKAFFYQDPVTLQEGTHTSAEIGGRMIQPDKSESVTGEVDHITIYHTPNNPVELKCMHDVEFSPGEQVILQQLDPVSYAVIGMQSGKEVEFKE
ncbi:hypothetical protein N7474_006620 [Penicillium riverlandense]|uniref:uncharacterized protein n=1 Tax=Penicillium riverlandense TaxID=1903569 RepID=UPI00254716DE|nr:uncharacterized protein N7474_006620 [Penicillium riverlandense]KAJ5814843.1 hypothetical protein N7474_006620 [Penicillium riverlandense]